MYSKLKYSLGSTLTDEDIREALVGWLKNPIAEPGSAMNPKGKEPTKALEINSHYALSHCAAFAELFTLENMTFLREAQRVARVFREVVGDGVPQAHA